MQNSKRLSFVPMVVVLLATTACHRGGRTAAPLVPYAITPATSRLAVDIEAQHGNAALATNASGTHLAVWSVERDPYQSTIVFAVHRGAAWSADAPVVGADLACPPAVASDGTNFMMVYRRGGRCYTRKFFAATDTWEAETRVDGGQESIGYQVAIAANSSGYAVAWVQHEGADPNASVHANVHSLGTGNWAGATQVGSGAASFAEWSGLSLASNGSGYALAWTQNEAGSSGVYASVFVGAGPWTTPVDVDATTQSASYQHMASNGSGYAITWTQGAHVYVSRFVGVWGVPVALDAASSAHSPQIASNGIGYAVTWTQDNFTSPLNVCARIWNGTSWGAVTNIEGLTGNDVQPRIASNGNGYAVVWSHSTAGVPTDLYVSVYGTSWSGELLENLGGNAFDPRITGGAGGYACAWSQVDAGRTAVHGRVRSGTWTTPTNLVTNTYTTHSSSPQIVANADGGMLAVWEQYSGHDRRLFGSMLAQGTWKAPFEIAAPGTHLADSPVLATNGSGYAVVWHEYSGAEMWANVYAEGAWTGPVALDLGSGTQQPDQYQVASNGSGYAVAWRADDGNFGSIYANVFANGAWTGLVAVESDTGNADVVCITSNGSGYAAAWRQGTTIRASVFSGAWGPATLLDGPSPIPIPSASDRPRIASDGSGYGVVWFSEYLGIRSIHANIFQGGAWSGDQVLSSSAGATEAPAIAANRSGYAAAWPSPDAAVNSLVATVHTGGAWGAAVPIGTGLFFLQGFRLAANDRGYALAWGSDDDASSDGSIRASVYADGIWDAEQRLEAGSGPVRTAPRLAANGSGFAVAWAQDDQNGGRSIFANAFNGVWTTTTLLDTLAGDAEEPGLAPAGNGYCAAWRQRDSANGINADAYQVWAAKF